VGRRAARRRHPISPHENLYAADISERTLRVLKTRRDIACVLVNPLQALTQRQSPADSALADSLASPAVSIGRVQRWLKSLRQVCSERNIVLIFDEVFVASGSRGGAQEYFACAPTW